MNTNTIGTTISSPELEDLSRKQEAYAKDYAGFKKTLGDFEGMIINLLMSKINKGGGDTLFSGGVGERVFQGELNQVLSKRSSEAGGFGFKTMMEKSYGKVMRGQLRYKYGLSKAQEPSKKMLLESERKLQETSYETIG
jgi:hypothetical protein